MLDTDDRHSERPSLSRGAAGAAGAPDPELAIRTAGLTKLYRSPWTMKVTRGLEDLDLEVRRGEVMGYLGPNGAGKTTTLKLLTGLHKPTRGAAWVFGVPVDETRSRRSIGFLPEQPYFYDHLSGGEYLELAGRLSGLRGREAGEMARRWMGRVGLQGAGSRRLRKYSKGMLQRLGLAAALIHAPDLLILDEPMSGLDPLGRRDVRDLLLEQRERGVTVLFSSHILPDVEMLCDRVAIVINGRLTRVVRVGELVNTGPQRVEVRCEGQPIVALPAPIGSLVTRLERPGETAFVLEDGGRLSELLAALLQAGVRVQAVTQQRAGLEDLYVETAKSGAGEPHAVQGRA
jgi:ABC-2 type transport system ATP-binding protein